MKNQLYIFLAFIIFVACQPAKIETYSPIETGPIAQSAMISSAHPLATKIGIGILKSGGNAIDAAVAVQFALTVVYPEAGNIGGGGFAVIRMADGTVSSLDFREKAPTAAFKDMYLDVNGDVITMNSRIGHLAAGVPGSVAGMWEMHQKYGVLPWGDLIRPAINLAYQGHLLTEIAAYNLNAKQDDFESANRYVPWIINRDGWKVGDSSVQKELATTFSFIQKNGRDGFYKGIVADQIAKEMQLGGGLITKEDLENYQPKWRKPVIGVYRGHKVISMPPPSSGGIALLQLLQGAEQFDFSKSGHNSPQTIHLMTELQRRVYADRATYLGDPDFYNVPADMLLDPAYNDERFSDIKKSKKTPSQDVKEGEVEIIESVETTHYSIVDKDGNAVSITTTLNGYYGCKVMVKGAGFFLNNEMDDFSAKAGVPNQFGLVGAEANAIAPGKRMLSSMTPTIVEKDGELLLVTGTPGGSTIITAVFQNIINVIDFGMTLQDAVNAKRTHSQWLPDVLMLEDGVIDSAAILTLESYGHQIVTRSKLGKIDAILKRPDGTLEGGADYTRGDEYAEGY
jgi:gamma-glutamyltranspeptidase/glutathione hydrolase